MGNPQHLEWLLEGVEAWNARRAREDFTPDLVSLNLPAQFHARNAMPDSKRLPLIGINLKGAALGTSDLALANLGGADLSNSTNWAADFSNADLGGANLSQADLTDASLQNANLGAADLRGAKFSRANLEGVFLGRADLRTMVHRGTNLFLTTNLKTAIGLSQNQLEAAFGDTGVILPEGLAHPDHWEVLEQRLETPSDGIILPEAEDGETDDDKGGTAPSGPDGEIISNLLRHAALHKLHAKDTAAQMRVAVSAALPAGANQIPLVFRITQDMADVLEAFADQTEESEEALRARIAELEAQVAALIAALEDAEARAEAEAVLAERLQGELEAATAEDGAFLAKFKEAAGEQSVKLPVFLMKGGALYYLAASLGPNNPLVKLLFEIVGKL